MWPEKNVGGQGPRPPCGPSALPQDAHPGAAAAQAAAQVRTLAVEHDVLRFEVPVDDALGVEVAQGQCDLCQVETAETGQGEGKGAPGYP